MEFDLLTCVAREGSAEIDEVLDRSRVDVRDGREVEHDGAQEGLAIVLLLLYLLELGAVALALPAIRSRVVPGSVALRRERVVLTVPGRLACVVLDLVGKVRRVDIDCKENGVLSDRRRLGSELGLQLTESFFHAEHDDAFGGRFDDNGRVPWRDGSQRDVDVADGEVSSLILLADSHSTEERSTRLSEAHEEERSRRGDGELATMATPSQPTFGSDGGTGAEDKRLT